MKVSTIVEQILQTSREARNSDKILWLRFMEHFGIYFTPGQKEIFKAMPSLETARRIRQKLQESGKYLADQAIGQERRFKGYSMQQRAPKLTQEDVEKVIESHAMPWLED